MQNEFQLMQSKESLDFALQSGKMGTWDINLETGQIACSKEMLDLWGVNPEEFTNQRSTLQSKVHPDDLEKMRTLIDEAIQKRSIYEFEYRIIPHPGILKWVCSRGRCTFAPESDTPVRFAGIVYDITERIQREQELAKAIRTRDEFFMVASHELRTPLTCLQLQIQVLQCELKHFEPKSSFTGFFEVGLKKQHDHLLRILRIVDNILDESKISEGKLSLQREEFELSTMTMAVLEQLKLTISNAEIDIQLVLHEKISGHWDRFRIEQVVSNLLMNAIRYGNKKPIQIEIRQENQNAIISVKDYGVGISPADHQKVFERFERINPEKERHGMGVGLFISKNIIEAHGGEIKLISEIDKGSEFIVVLPMTNQPA